MVLGLAGLLSALAAYFIVSHVRGLRQEDAIAVHAEEIFRSPTSFVGNPNGDVGVVAFFDYNCPYCRDGAPDLKRLVSEDGKVRLVLKELPVLGQAKLEADMDSPGVEDVIAANKRLADRLEVEGVPFYLVGDRPRRSLCRADRRRGGCAAAWLPGGLLNLIGPLISSVGHRDGHRNSVGNCA